MVAIPPSPTQVSLRNRDTGFPEPFCGSRNTSLPHPEANLNPDACITEDDVNPTRALMRHRMSFMNQQEQQERERKLTGSSEDGTLSAFSRLAISSLRNGDLPRLAEGIDAFLSSNNKDGDSIVSSDGMSSQDPESPTLLGRPFDHPKEDPRDGARDPRDDRHRKGGFMNRLMHR